MERRVALNPTETDTLELAPLGYIYLSEDLAVVFVNRYARRLIHCEPGESIIDFLHPDVKKRFDRLVEDRNPDQSVDLQLMLDIGSKAIQASCSSNRNGGIDLFVQDISESKMLGRQLQESSKPARRFVHDISNALGNAIGYAELLTMMLSEEEMFAGQKLAAIRRYQNAVSEGLASANALIQQERSRKNQMQMAQGPDQVLQVFKGRDSKSASSETTAPLVQRHVVIVDDEPSIAEFLAELVRSSHYKATVFTKSMEAYDYLALNNEPVDLLIVDQVMPELTGVELANNLHATNVKIPVVLCTTDHDFIDDPSEQPVNIRHLISKPVDIRELTELISSVID
mgnify:FL=1